MSGIVRYILRQLVVGMALVTMGLTFIIWLTQSIKFVEMVVNKGASLTLFMKLTLLLIPNFLTIILPVALFTVVLFTYNKLISDREMVVLRAAGLSHIMLARPALVLAAASFVVGLALNIWVIPRTVTEFHKMQFLLRSNASGIMLQEGQFNQLGNGLTVYVRARSPQGDELLGVIVHDRRNKEQPMTIIAERGKFIKNETGAPIVVLYNAVRDASSRRLSVLTFPDYKMEFTDTSEGEEEERVRDARERPMDELFSTTEAQAGPVLFRQLRVEGHTRLASPLYHFAYALVAASCLLCGWFNRRGQTDRLILGFVLLILIQAAALGANSLATKNLAWIPLIYITPLIPTFVALWALLRPSIAGRAGPALSAG